jgi:hypothetical protein
MKIEHTIRAFHRGKYTTFACWCSYDDEMKYKIGSLNTFKINEKDLNLIRLKENSKIETTKLFFFK